MAAEEKRLMVIWNLSCLHHPSQTHSVSGFGIYTVGLFFPINGGRGRGMILKRGRPSLPPLSKRHLPLYKSSEAIIELYGTFLELSRDFRNSFAFLSTFLSLSKVILFNASSYSSHSWAVCSKERRTFMVSLSTRKYTTSL